MLVYSFVVAYIIGTIIQRTIGFRLDEESEVAGIDSVVHAETAYDFARWVAAGSGPLGRPGARRGPNTEGVRGMKLVTAIIKPFKLDDVKNALE